MVTTLMMGDAIASTSRLLLLPKSPTSVLLSSPRRRSPLVHNSTPKAAAYSTISPKLSFSGSLDYNNHYRGHRDHQTAHLSILTSCSRRLWPPTVQPHHQMQRRRLTIPRFLKLTPSNRTRVTNLAFLVAAVLSVVTVSLGMSGVSSQAMGVGLPCPARRTDGVGMEGREGEREWVNGDPDRRRKGLSTRRNSSESSSSSSKSPSSSPLSPVPMDRKTWIKNKGFMDDPVVPRKVNKMVERPVSSRSNGPSLPPGTTSPSSPV